VEQELLTTTTDFLDRRVNCEKRSPFQQHFATLFCMDV
jgi:hypothetical protein